MVKRVATALLSIVFFASLGGLLSGGALLLSPQPAYAAIECGCPNFNPAGQSAFAITYCGFKCTAQGAGLPKADEPEVDPQAELVRVVGSIANALLALLGVIFSVLVIASGIMWMSSAGEEEKIQKAQKMITAGIVGLLITVGSFLLVNFVMGRIVGSIVGV